jgi:hypothetical protein
MLRRVYAQLRHPTASKRCEKLGLWLLAFGVDPRKASLESGSRARIGTQAWVNTKSPLTMRKAGVNGLSTKSPLSTREAAVNGLSTKSPPSTREAAVNGLSTDSCSPNEQVRVQL